jgi:hypothetical protein
MHNNCISRVYNDALFWEGPAKKISCPITERNQCNSLLHTQYVYMYTNTTKLRVFSLPWKMRDEICIQIGSFVNLHTSYRPDVHLFQIQIYFGEANRIAGTTQCTHCVLLCKPHGKKRFTEKFKVKFHFTFTWSVCVWIVGRRVNIGDRNGHPERYIFRNSLCCCLMKISFWWSFIHVVAITWP